MNNRPDISLPEQIGAALDWWRDAGVDHDFVEEVQKWLAEPEAVIAATEKAAKSADPHKIPEHRPAISAADFPSELGAFAQWWASEANPARSGPSTLVAPRGPAKAGLLMLVSMPEEQDRETLLSGPQGEMLAKIAQAIKIAPDALYFASALPMHMPHPDWEMLANDGLGTALQHHINLAAPERILVFGTNLPALLGHGGSPEKLSEVNGIPALATFAPDRLLQHKRQRARLWERLQNWISN